jgi:hypothetical protein
MDRYLVKAPVAMEAVLGAVLDGLMDSFPAHQARWQKTAWKAVKPSGEAAPLAGKTMSAHDALRRIRKIRPVAKR